MRFLQVGVPLSGIRSFFCCIAPYSYEPPIRCSLRARRREEIATVQSDPMSRKPEMHEPLPDDGTIRKLWIGETDAYRDHLLRLDRDSRHRRFSGTVSDEFIARHAATANEIGVVVHGFFIDGVLRGAAELRQNGSLFSHTADAAF